MTITGLQQVAHQRSVDAGWWNGEANANLPTKIALMHSELSEALEGLRRDSMDDHLPHRKSVEVEMADAMIRIADFCGRLGLDLEGAIIEKMRYNLCREDHKREVREKGGKRF